MKRKKGIFFKYYLIIILFPTNCKMSFDLNNIINFLGRQEAKLKILVVCII